MTTRFTGSAGCCAAAPSISLPPAGRACWPASRPGDHDGQVAAAWVAAQELRDRDQASARLYHWTVTCIDSHVPELRRLARTLTTWRTKFLAYFSTGPISNGPTEALNLLSVAHGFRNFHNYRLRLRLHCGIT